MLMSCILETLYLQLKEDRLKEMLGIGDERRAQSVVSGITKALDAVWEARDTLGLEALEVTTGFVGCRFRSA